MNIILAGMPASGKTTVSALLGAALGRKVIDTDALIVEEHGEITQIFARYGEKYFRDLETEAVKKASSAENAVISTGGGCFLRENNALLFKRSGRIIYLKTSLKTLVSRTVGDTTRPLLAGGAEERIEKLLAERRTVYESCADYTVTTDGKTAEEVAAEIVGLTGEFLQ